MVKTRLATPVADAHASIDSGHHDKMDVKTWEKHLRTIVDGIVTTDISQVKYTLETYFAQDVMFYHPYFIARGRDEAYKIFEMWSGSNAELTGEIHHIAINEEEQTAMIELSQLFKQKLFGAYFPLSIRLVVILKWRDEADGARRICYQRDIHEPSSLITYLPVIGNIYTNWIRPNATYAWTTTYKIAEQTGVLRVIPRFAKQVFPMIQYMGMLPVVQLRVGDASNGSGMRSAKDSMEVERQMKG
ncbi:hypothetical protein SeMB42_g05663 [Synchytrium endobioticum]|uniref:SigF-like NTF2-like domain-containing protein n=1 Tax=Synchytrium endobioticum TaxID=286115 RepID=A0A507CK34_9FUNG|nr:hypothetical protein SeLEV6574_g06761 [Synchytrium endobioticum]TPX41231.1 hypothetical protein SeMB42_g05663 [Synchytrium endobioticum]